MRTVTQTACTPIACIQEVQPPYSETEEYKKCKLDTATDSR